MIGSIRPVRATGPDAAARPLATLRWPAVALFVAAAVLPFAFTTIPPLTDVPGHIGRFAVQTARPGSVLLRDFAFHWTLTLNLASDLIVALVHPAIGLVPLIRLLCALTPALTVVGLVAIARLRNPTGATALPWALLYVFNFPFLWGFLNFALTAALGLVLFAAWIGLANWPRWRAALFLVATPALLIGHGVAGVLMLGWIVGDALWAGRLYRRDRWSRAATERLAVVWPPVVAGIVTLVAWRAVGVADGGHTVWLGYRKFDGILMMLRDQNAVLDVAAVVASIAVWIVGWRWGARLHGATAGPVVVTIALFLATPSLIAGSDQIDTRIAPMIPMLAFVLQDWSGVTARRRRWIAGLGFALLAVRMAVTTWSFAGYDARYHAELAALDHVAPGSRILNLTHDDCDLAGWRSARLEHLANLATLRRSAWVNAHWSISGVQLLEVRYHPSRIYDRDPSQLIWPAHCLDPALPFAERNRHMLRESLPMLPLDRVDYLWLVGERLPAGYRDPRLRRLWRDDISELYATDGRIARQ